jgi:hypothetical protein
MATALQIHLETEVQSQRSKGRTQTRQKCASAAALFSRLTVRPIGGSSRIHTQCEPVRIRRLCMRPPASPPVLAIHSEYCGGLHTTRWTSVPNATN